MLFAFTLNKRRSYVVNTVEIVSFIIYVISNSILNVKIYCVHRLLSPFVCINHFHVFNVENNKNISKKDAATILRDNQGYSLCDK